MRAPRRRTQCAPIDRAVADRRACLDDRERADRDAPASTVAPASTTALGCTPAGTGARVRARPPLREPREVEVRVGRDDRRAARQRRVALSAGATMTQPACVVASCARYVGLARKRERRRRRGVERCRCASIGSARIADQLAAERGDDVGERASPHRLPTCAPCALSALITFSVMSTRGPAKTASCRIRSYFSVSKICLMTLLARSTTRGQLLVLALVQVFLELAALALELAVLLDQLALAAAALGFGQRRRFLLELVGRGLQPVRQVGQFLLALAELGLELGLRGLRGRRLAQHAIAVDVADLQLLRLRRVPATRQRGRDDAAACNAELFIRTRSRSGIGISGFYRPAPCGSACRSSASAGRPARSSSGRCRPMRAGCRASTFSFSPHTLPAST